MATANEQPPQEILEEIKSKRRLERWNAFWTPFIALASIVTSVAMLMFLVRTCQERNLPPLLLPPSSPLHGRGAAGTPLLEPEKRTDEHDTAPAPAPKRGRANGSSL